MPKDVYLDEGMKKWIAKTARKEHWRMAAWYDLGDLTQDGFVCYCKCRDKYVLQPPEPGHTSLNTDNPTSLQRRHFANLVKTAFTNHILTLAGRFALAKEDAFTSVLREDQNEEQLFPPQPEEASLFLALSKAPAELRDFVDLLLKDGVEGGDYLRTRAYKEGARIRRGRRQLRETSKEFWQRVVGDGDLPEKLAAYLRS